jgi:lysophospholipase L1-like esterase
VGTNDVTSVLTVGEILSQYCDLISIIRKHTHADILMSAILPRPIDFETSGEKVKNINNKLMSLCKDLKCSYIRTFKPFLKGGKPRREFFAVRDGGLHLNIEGTRRLRQFFVNTISHLN